MNSAIGGLDRPDPGGCLLTQEWPQWGGVNRDGKVTGFSAPIRLASRLPAEPPAPPAP